MAADNSGVVDQNIDPAHRRHRLVDQTAHIILLAEIRLNGVKAAAQRQHLGGRIMGNFTVDADDIAPGLRQAQRHSPVPGRYRNRSRWRPLPVRSKAFSTIFTPLSADLLAYDDATCDQHRGRKTKLQLK